MKRVASLVVASALAVVLAVAPDAGAGDPPDPTGADTFALALGGKAINNAAERAKLFDYDIVVIDGEDAPNTLIDNLHTEGVIVLGYLSVGTIEKYRSWYPDAKPYRGPLWGDWGEWYAKVNKVGFRTLILGAVAPDILAKDFDGLFLDNTDMIDGFPKQVPGMQALVAGLAALVETEGALLFTQNGEESLVDHDLLDHFDGWNREDVTSTYSFGQQRYRRLPAPRIAENQQALEAMAAAGLFVSATDYVKKAGSAVEAAAVANACAAGAVPFASTINLNRIPAPPLTCA